MVSMWERGRLETLVRLRRLAEGEARHAHLLARRNLGLAEEDVDARAARLQDARAELEDSEKSIRERGMGGKPAGSQALMDGLLAERRRGLTTIEHALGLAEKARQQAAGRVERTRGELERALHARKTADAEQARQRSAELRRRARRDQLYAEDARLSRR